MKKLIILLAIFLSLASHAQTTWLVDSLNDSGFGSLRAAADSCSAGDTIRFNPNLIANGSDSIVLTSGEIAFGNRGVVIKGLFNSIDTLFISGNQNSRIFYFNGAGGVVLDSLVLRNGHSTNLGGAIYRNNCFDTLFIMNSKIADNYALQGGGAIWSNSPSYPTCIFITKSVLFKNLSDGYGGGAIRSRSYNASSLVQTYSVVSFHDCRLIKNSTTGGGGVVYSEATHNSITIDLSEVLNNSGGSGAVINCSAWSTNFTVKSSVNLEIKKSNVFGNHAGYGGVVYAQSSKNTIDIIRSTFNENSATIGNGGVISSANCDVFSKIKIFYSSFFNNKSTNGTGGAVWVSAFSSNIEVKNSTFFNNTGSTKKGAIHVPNYTTYSTSSIIIGSSIFLNNGNNYSGISNYKNPRLISHGYNIFSDSLNGVSALDSTNVNVSQVNLRPLTFNGGPSMTMIPDIGSIAIDNGNPVDSSDAQNLPINGRRDIGAAEHCVKSLVTDTIVTCNSYYTWIDGVTYEENNTMATYELSDSTNCGTIVTLNLTLHSPVTIDTVYACDSVIWIDGNTYYPNHGLVTDTLINSGGCDSVVKLHFIPSNYAIDYQVACDSLVWINGLTYYSNNNSAIDTLTSVFGCDSIVYLDLQILSSFSPIIMETVCDSFISPSGKIWDSTGVYHDTILNSNNCDSIITIDLTVNFSTFEVLNITVCDSLISPSGSFIWYVSGTYQDTLLNSRNCDSIITINLSVLESSSSIIFIEECYSYSSPSGIYSWDSSGVYQDTILNSVGCDSLITINLTIKNSTSYSVVNVCDWYLSPSGNYTWTTSGLYSDTLRNSLNCDSLITIDLRVNNTSEVIYATVCDSLVSPSGNYVWYSSGTYFDTLVNSFNCDSNLTMNLTINNTTWATINQSVCDSLVSPSGKYVWTNSGVYYDTVLNASGCDSLITYILTVKESSNSTVTELVCGEYVSPSGNYVWTNSGVYLDTVLNSVGCDSVLTINLTVFDTLSTEIHFVCDSLTWINGVTYYSDNTTAIDTFQNALGCDSLVYLDLTVYSSFEVVDSLVGCDSLVWIDGNTYYSNNNSAIYYGASVNGCDSVVTLDLTVNPSVNVIDTVSACLFYQWIDGQVYLSDNNTATQTFVGSNGCDSVVTLDLDIHYGTVGVDTQWVCDSLVWIDGNTYYSDNSIATYTLIGGNSHGCDSVVTLNLTVNGSQSTDVITACDSLTWINGVTYYSSTHMVTDTFLNVLGCDSVVTLNLTIMNSSSYVDVINTCDSLIWIDGVTYYSSNSSAAMTFVNSVGCDSVVYLDLTISNATTYVDEITSCMPLIWLDGVTYTQSISGPSYTLINAQGCDSMVTLDFTLTQADTSVVRNYLTLTANASNATFQWINCVSGVISGATQQSYTVTANGAYQVEVTQNGCVDTSGCFSVTNVGIGEVNLSNNINIFPNPVHDQVNIEITNWPTNDVEIVVRDITGKQVYTQEVEPISNKETIQINTSKWAKGTYFIEVGGGEKRVVEKIVVQ